MEELVFEIGIEERQDGGYKEDGFFIMRCPKCQLKMRFNLKPLPNNLTLSPKISLRHEWTK